MIPTFIVISSDEEDTIQKPVRHLKQRPKPSHDSKKAETQTPYCHAKVSTHCEGFPGSSSFSASQRQVSAPRSRTADIILSKDADHAATNKRSVSVPPPDRHHFLQTTHSEESHLRNRTSGSAEGAATQNMAELKIVEQANQSIELALPYQAISPVGTRSPKRPVDPTSSPQSRASCRIPADTLSHASGTSGTTLVNNTTAIGAYPSRQPPPRDSLKAAGTGRACMCGHRFHDADRSTPPGPVTEYPWPPSSINVVSAHNPYSSHYEQEEVIQGPYFLATTNPTYQHHHRNMLPFQRECQPLKYPLAQSQREVSSQTPCPIQKRKQQLSSIERVPCSKRARNVYSPAPTTTIPTGSNQQQHHLNHQYSSPVPATTSARRPRSRPWTSAMIADMAQTLQYSFPFADFGAKHGKAPSEVFEAFSAVVQMPLFEYSAKGMARARMKGFQDRIRDYREKGKEIERMHRREERRKEKGKGKAKEKEGEKEKDGVVIASGEKSAAGEGRGFAGYGEKRKATFEQARGMDKDHEKRSKITTMITSPLEGGYTPTSSAIATKTAARTATAPTPKPRARAIAPETLSNRTPVLELRDGIYMLTE